MSNPAKILIVDDEPFNIDALEQELEDLGYATISAANGREALEQVEAENPDLILLDIMMPEMDGFEALTHLKASQNWRNIPVIVISAMSDLSSVVKGIKLGAEDYLSKPFNEVLLRARLEAGLTKKRLREQEKELLQLAMLREMNEFGKLLILIIGCLAITIVINLILTTYTTLDPASTLTYAITYTLLAGPLVYFVKRSTQPWSAYGVTWQNHCHVITEALIFSVPLLIFLLAGQWLYLILTNQSFTFQLYHGAIYEVIYFPLSYLQEFVARGVLQNSLQRFLQDENGFISIIWASICFSLMHLGLGPQALLISFMGSLLFGAIFLRQQNLIGVTIVHWLIGVWASVTNLL